MVLAALLSIFLVGCSMARGVNELLPGAQYSTPVNIDPLQVEVFRNGVQPRGGCIMVANIAAHGNAYATTETLEQNLREQAATLKANIVMVQKLETTKDQTVGTYGGGIILSDSIQRPHLYGVACRSPKVGIGISFNRADGTVLYVLSNSPAARIGITEGDKILAVNGSPLQGDPLVIEREISSKQPGDRATVEFLTKNSVKIRQEIILEAVEAWSGKDNQVKPATIKPIEP